MSEMNKLNEENLENVTGGNDGMGLGGWVYGTVHGVVHYDASSCLTLRDSPDGNVMFLPNGKPMGWQNGDRIPVRPSSRRWDWIQAKYNGTIGWTNANYVSY